MPIVGTATLAERIAPYMLAVELARGKLNDIRNQLSDWLQMGLRSTPDLEQGPGRGAACVCPMCHVDGSTRRVQRGRSRLSSIVLARRRPVDRGLHGADTPEPARLDVQAVHAPGLRPGCSSPETAVGDRLAKRFQYMPPGRFVEASGSVGGPVPLGPARCPASVVPLEGPDVRGRAVDRLSARWPSRLDLALGGRLRRDQWSGG